MSVGGLGLTRVPVSNVRNLAGLLKKVEIFLPSTLISSSQTLPEQFFQIVPEAQTLGGVSTGTHATESRPAAVLLTETSISPGFRSISAAL